MLNLSNVTVRLGGRTILDGATAALPPRSRVGLIGRNGAGKTTLVRVVAGSLEPDGGSADMPRGARIGYIAQEAPGGAATPLETVLAADTERSALLAEAETCEDMDRIGEVPRAPARHRRAFGTRPRRPHPGRPGLRRSGAGPSAGKLLGRLADARRARQPALLRSRTCCCSTSRPTTSIWRPCYGSRTS
jgi:energy-coupling factor transporter ATP-binding protein EcfA2